MKPENNIYNKTKFFALYWGQNVAVWRGHLFNNVDPSDMEYGEWLQLTPLSKITDEDAIEVANILRWSYLSDEAKIAQVRQLIDKHLNTQTNITFIEWIEVAGYLRSRGYLVPWMGLTPDEIVSYGWAQYKEG